MVADVESLQNIKKGEPQLDGESKMFPEGKLSDRISSNLAVVIVLYLTFEMCSSEYLAASTNREYMCARRRDPEQV